MASNICEDITGCNRPATTIVTVTIPEEPNDPRTHQICESHCPEWENDMATLGWEITFRPMA